MALPPPDFARVTVNQPAPKPVGSPRLWGNEITTQIDQAAAAYGQTISSGQIVLAQAADHYSRSWSLLGNVTMPVSYWDIPSAEAAPPLNPFDVQGGAAPRDDMIDVWLEIVQGIEMMTTTQYVLLSAGATSQRWGLIPNQITTNGGPYGQSTQRGNYPPPFTGQIVATRSFAMIGALVGNTISIRAIYVRGGVLGEAPNLRQITMQLLITPYAPGAGI